jgi:hypothetical protein
MFGNCCSEENKRQNYSMGQYLTTRQRSERKNIQNSLSYGKNRFSAILKIAAILKITEKIFPIFWSTFLKNVHY